jgi:hypothetical protein
MNFEATELGTDMSFHDLPNYAQTVAMQIIEDCKGCINPERCIVRELDCNAQFRDAIGVRNMDILPQQVDVVVRYWRWLNDRA